MHTLIIFILSLVAVSAQAQPAKGAGGEAACATQAKAWFQKEHGTESKAFEDGRARKSAYRSHYSAKLKQCLVLDEMTVTRANGTTALSGRSLFTLEGDRRASLGRVVGPQKPLTCEMQGKRCESVEEWDKLAAVLMKE